MTQMQFAGLGLAQPLLRAVHDAGYAIPTPIQAQAIPLVLAGGDLLAAAQTGTGKTAGFVLPILHRLNSAPNPNARPGRPRCLILTPTRELAAQVEESVTTYGKHLAIRSMVMFGGVGIQPQIANLRKRVDILVATPGRLLDHAGQRTVDLSGIEILVLDEGDRMLDMGFIHDIRRIIALLPRKRQSMLFSATFSDEVRALAATLLNDPVSVDVAPRNAPIELVKQTVHLVGKNHKREALSHLIQANGWEQVLVFTRTKHGANRLAEKLGQDGIRAAAIHGNKSQAARTRALAQFKKGELPVLVATDIAARGLDIEELPHVVNFELPNVPEDYVHRIGRTGRAGSSGTAVSLVDSDETQLLRDIEKLIRQSIERVPLEGFVASTGSSVERDDRSRHANVGKKPAQHGRSVHEHRGRRGAQPSESRAHSRQATGDRATHRTHHAPHEGAHANRTQPARSHDADRDRSEHNSRSSSGKPVSEAARHQAQAQPALFTPASRNRRRG